MSQRPDMVTEARASIRSIIGDPATKLLMENSHLTQTQLETLLADSLSSENDSEKGHRRLFRPSRTRISRGAYNRSLIQAQNNVIRSIYTVLLLGYVGLFDTAALQPFIELSDSIQAFVHEASQTGHDQHEVIDELSHRLVESVSTLAKRQSFKDAL